MVEAARGQPRIPHALGADLAVRRSDPGRAFAGGCAAMRRTSPPTAPTRFSIFRMVDQALIGGVTLANVRRGIVQAGTIGYWTGEQFAGQGYMTLALARAAAVHLQRIEPASHRGRLHSRPTRPRCGCWRNAVSSAKVWRAAISASTASGRITPVRIAERGFEGLGFHHAGRYRRRGEGAQGAARARSVARGAAAPLTLLRPCRGMRAFGPPLLV